MNILDWYCHGGAQYEFMKLPYNFYLVNPNGTRPVWDDTCRPLPANVTLITEDQAKKLKFDRVIVRSPVPKEKYLLYQKKKIELIATVQTTSPYNFPQGTTKIVWNTLKTMKKFQSNNYKNYYIVHGFDPNEFVDYKQDRISRVLTVANAFKKRAKIMGYYNWDLVNDRLKICDIVGHQNETISPYITSAKSFKELIDIYNKYLIFYNPTVDSAMPRSRAEAAMCGMALVSTNNFGIDKYFTDKKNILFANSAEEAITDIQLLLENPNKAYDLGQAARECAIKNFHIDKYLESWKKVLE